MANKRLENIKSFSDFVEMMVKGLEKQWVVVDMDTFGSYRPNYVGPCFGCAATNALCEIMGEAFNAQEIGYASSRADKFNFDITESEFETLESAYDCLRRGQLSSVLYHLRLIKDLLNFEIPEHIEIRYGSPLPHMYTYDWRNKLPIYKEYVKWLKEKGL